MFKMETEQGTSNTVILGIIGLIGLVFCGVFGLAALGRDIGQVIYFIGPTLVVLGGVLVQLTKVNKLVNKTDEQTEKIDNISKAVNGELDAKFDRLHKAIQANHDEVQGLSNQVGNSRIVLPDMEGLDDESSR